MAAARWPTMTDYQEAVQAPRICFSDKQLAAGTAVVNKLGLPRPICGQFASVYEIESGGARWAIKCFLRNIPDLHSRYAKIAAHIGTVELPYFVTFDYLRKGIRIRGDVYPIVKMEWDEGLGLNQYIEKNVTDRAVLEQLEQNWLQLLEDLQSVKIAHGDLQHGNVLVGPDGTLRLIDYDGMWVPKLKGQGSHETGHPDYQSPLRTGDDFHEGIDQFAGDVIHMAIRALIRKPDLWQKYDNGDNIVFRRGDYLDPKNSALFAELRALGDDQIDPLLDGVIAACAGKAKRGPSRFFKPKKPRQAPPAPAPAPAAPAPAPPPAPPKAAPARAAQQKAAPPRPAPAKPSGPGGWLSDHVSTVPRPSTPAPAAAAPRAARPATAPPAAGPAAAASPAPATPSPAAQPSRSHAGSTSLGAGLLGKVRVLLHLLLVCTTGWVVYTEVSIMVADSGDRGTAMLAGGVGLAALLGLTSLVSLFTGRVIHRVTSTLFFGVTGLMAMLAIFADLLIDGWSVWTTEEPLRCAVMLTMLFGSGLALIVEVFCRRMGVVTRWQLPWSGD